MKIEWKTFRKSFPYICTSCGGFSNMEREYCEECGKKDSLRRTYLEDYENHIKTVINQKSQLDEPQKEVNRAREQKKFKFGYVILIIISGVLVIDLIAFFLIMDILNISLDEIDNALPILYTLIGFSLIMFVLLIVFIYAAYYRGKAEYIIFWEKKDKKKGLDS